MDLCSIYPKQFRNHKIPIEKDRCFVIMPFQKEYNKLYGIIKDALSDSGITCFRDDEIFGPQPYMNKVITEILRARYVIVILTDYRPNVLYELGITHCFKDIQNVLILSDKGSNIHNNVSDLSHLTCEMYDINNPHQLRSKIEDFIQKNKISLDFQEFLFEHNIITVISENTNDFIPYIERKFANDFPLLIDLLLKRDLVEEDKKRIIAICHEVLYEQIDTNGMYIDMMLKIFAECLIVSKNLYYSETYVHSFITDELIRGKNISNNLKLQWKMDFVIFIAEQECFLDVLIPWMIEYIKRTKSSTIDLNRYKLESFLINTNISKINEALCNALREQDFHIREHLSDIIGEKKLYLAFSCLNAALVNETSLYAGKSMIVALGKLGQKNEEKTAENIIDWIKNNIDKIISSGADFTNSILTKSRVAILQLYPKCISKFDCNFDEYITNKKY